MCLVDDGTGTGTKIAQYFVDTDGNYNELYTYVLYSPDRRRARELGIHAQGHARQPGEPERDATGAGDAEQRQPDRISLRRSTRSRT